MPTVLRIDGYRFFFFSNEGNEPLHLAANSGYTGREITRIRELIEQHQQQLLVEAWNEFFNR